MSSVDLSLKKGSPKKATPKKTPATGGSATKASTSAAASSSAMDTTNASDAAEKDNSFRQFRKLCADLAEENSYNGKTSIVKKYITNGTTEGNLWGPQ